DAAIDLDTASYATYYSMKFADSAKNLQLTQQLLEQRLAQSPNDPQHLLDMAHFLDWRGDRETDPIKRFGFHKRADSYYAKALQNENPPRPGAVLNCFIIKLKINDVAAAKTIAAAFEKEKPRSLETLVMQVNLLEREGKKDKAKAKLDEVAQGLM